MTYGTDRAAYDYATKIEHEINELHQVNFNIAYSRKSFIKDLHRLLYTVFMSLKVSKFSSMLNCWFIKKQTKAISRRLFFECAGF